MKTRTFTASLLTFSALLGSIPASAGDIIHCAREGRVRSELRLFEQDSTLYGFEASRTLRGCSPVTPFTDSGTLIANEAYNGRFLGYTDGNVRINLGQDGSITYANANLGFQLTFTPEECSDPHVSDAGQ